MPLTTAGAGEASRHRKRGVSSGTLLVHFGLHPLTGRSKLSGTIEQRAPLQAQKVW